MPEQQTDAELTKKWQAILGHEHRTIFSGLPTDPRCQVCRIPFAGVGGLVGRAMGFKPWKKNPTLCNRCMDSMPSGGIEIDTAVFFADIRGSTALGEKLGSLEFANLLKQYYEIAIDVLVPRRAVIDKMIGDEVMALFLPLAGTDYRRVAVESAVALQHAVASASWPGDMPKIGIGINAGEAFIGRIGGTDKTDFTALGDTVNVAARLQSEAGPGELVLNEGLFTESSDLVENAEKRTISVRGRQEPVEVRVAQIVPA